MGTKDLFYPGAVKVLENLNIIQEIKRFAGVGIGAIRAALLVAGFHCKSMQYLYNQISGYLPIDG